MKYRGRRSLCKWPLYWAIDVKIHRWNSISLPKAHLTNHCHECKKMIRRGMLSVVIVHRLRFVIWSRLYYIACCIHEGSSNNIWFSPFVLLYMIISKPPLVQIMACRLVGTKPLSESVLPQKEILVKSLVKLMHFHAWKCIWKCRLRNGDSFVSASMC